MKLPEVRMARLRKGFFIALAAGLCLGARGQPPLGPLFTNSLGMELVRMGPGTFTMGIEEKAETLKARTPDGG